MEKIEVFLLRALGGVLVGLSLRKYVEYFICRVIVAGKGYVEVKIVSLVPQTKMSHHWAVLWVEMIMSKLGKRYWWSLLCYQKISHIFGLETHVLIFGTGWNLFGIN